ncbi:hypothetical protein RIF29_11439 [Crotalaria pallida]|uniref:RWP-RK domain-containing protein n=1 Tax=Crotalaria pallida TaxID=3830 RepID=A0AAN9IM48_CROPI
MELGDSSSDCRNVLSPLCTYDRPSRLNWEFGITFNPILTDNELGFAGDGNMPTIMDFSPWDDDFFEFQCASSQPQFHYQSNQLCFNGYPELENLNFDDFDLLPLDENFLLEEKPLNMVIPQPQAPLPSLGFGEQAYVGASTEFGICVKEEVMEENNEEMLLLHNNNRSDSCSSKKRTCDLKFEEISKYFGVPEAKAAKEMNIGLTLLKKRCRQLKIKRWPHRKFKSLELLIDNVKEMGLSNEVAKLEQLRKMLKKLPGLELTEEIKKLRQACFKASYKKRRIGEVVNVRLNMINELCTLHGAIGIIGVFLVYIYFHVAGMSFFPGNIVTFCTMRGEWETHAAATTWSILVVLWVTMAGGDGGDGGVMARGITARAMVVGAGVINNEAVQGEPELVVNNEDAKIVDEGQVVINNDPAQTAKTDTEVRPPKLNIKRKRARRSALPTRQSQSSKILYVAKAQKKAEREQILHNQFEEKRKEQILKYKESNIYVKNINDNVNFKLKSDTNLFEIVKRKTSVSAIEMRKR